MPSRGSSQPRINRASPALAGGFFTTAPLGKTLHVCVFVSLYTYVCVCVYRHEMCQKTKCLITFRLRLSSKREAFSSSISVLILGMSYDHIG